MLGPRLLALAAPPRAAPSAVVVALHGVNDHARVFAAAAAVWAQEGIVTYGYDQRCEAFGTKGMLQVGNVHETSMSAWTADGRKDSVLPPLPWGGPGAADECWATDAAHRNGNGNAVPAHTLNMKTEARKPYAEVEAGVAEGLRNDLGTAEEPNLTIIKNAISFIVLFSEFIKSLQYTHNRL